MKPLARILLAVVALLVVLAAALAVAVKLLVDPQHYRPLLAEAVQRATGRTLTLDGELGLDFFPCCALTLGPATLGNPPGFPPEPFARMASASLSLRLWPLITRGEVAVGRVRLQGLDVNLLVRADGADNWSFTPAAASAGAAGGSTRDEPAALAIAGIEIRDGRLRYRDEQDGSDYLLGDLQLRTGDLAPGKAFDLELATRLTDATDATTGTLAVEARATLDAALERLVLERPRIALEATGGAVPAKMLRATLTPAELGIEFATDTRFAFRALGIELEITGLEAAAGDLAGRLDAGDARLVSGVSNELTLPTLGGDLTLRGADIPGGSIAVRLDAAGIGVDLDKLHGAIERFGLVLDGLGARLELTGAGRFAGSDAALGGEMTLAPVSPRDVLAVLKTPAPATADPKALTRLAGRTDWRYDAKGIEFTEIDATLDDTRLTGRFGLSGFEAPRYRFDLALDALDLDRYLGPDAPPDAEGEGDAAAATAAEADIPVELLRDLALDGRVKLGRLGFAGATLGDVSATLRAAGGRLRIDPLTAALYGGRYRGAVGIDATGPLAAITLDQQLDAVQVAPVLRDLYGSDKLTGVLSGRIDVRGRGNAGDAIVRTLAGTVALSLADGAYLGTDLWHEIRSARARLKGEAPPGAPAQPRTPLEALEIAGAVTEGVLRTERLVAQVPFIRLGGGGTLDLPQKALDLRLQGEVFETPVFDDGTRFDDLTGFAIPLTVRGPMDEPKVSVDLRNLTKNIAVKKLRDRLLEKLGGDEPAAAPEDSAAPAEGATEPAPAKPEKPRDALKRSLRELLEKQ